MDSHGISTVSLNSHDAFQCPQSCGHKGIQSSAEKKNLQKVKMTSFPVEDKVFEIYAIRRPFICLPIQDAHNSLFE